jgi:hypothetical protein
MLRAKENMDEWQNFDQDLLKKKAEKDQLKKKTEDLSMYQVYEGALP